MQTHTQTDQMDAHGWTWEHAQEEWIELRDKISALAKEKAEDVSDWYHAAIENLQDELATAEKKLSTAKSNAPDAWDEMKVGMKSGLSDLRHGY